MAPLQNNSSIDVPAQESKNDEESGDEHAPIEVGTFGPQNLRLNDDPSVLNTPTDEIEAWRDAPEVEKTQILGLYDLEVENRYGFRRKNSHCRYRSL